MIWSWLTGFRSSLASNTHAKHVYAKRKMSQCGRLLIILCLFTWSAQSAAARPCAPWEDRAGLYGEVIEHGLTSPAGPYLTWMCGQIVDANGKPATWGQWRITHHCIEGSWATNTLAMLGSRAETIRKAPDPSATWHASIKRHVVHPSARCAAVLASYRRPAKGEQK